MKALTAYRVKQLKSLAHRRRVKKLLKELGVRRGDKLHIKGVQWQDSTDANCVVYFDYIDDHNLVFIEPIKKAYSRDYAECIPLSFVKRSNTTKL